MAMTVSAREAHARFAGLLDRASRGETIIITRLGEEIARLIPGRAANELLPGRMKRRIWIAPDFDATPPEVMESIERDLEPR
ncbi:MAG TPA: type II toxin-antitoxin system prevent-host-death family antitoxin [Geminicoccaceae bacterium]|nr:type II toxin-antitoxin system prevent-host-death family antitoxin [Geminicoccaceae bacterium]